MYKSIDIKVEPYSPTEVHLCNDGIYITIPGHRYSYFLTEKAAQHECDRLNGLRASACTLTSPTHPKEPG